MVSRARFFSKINFNSLIESTENAVSEVSEKATYETFSTTVSSGASSWPGSGPYIATQTVNGILSSDSPIVDINMSSVPYSDVDSVQNEWGDVYRVEASADNQIKLYSKSVPTNNFILNIKVFR